MNSVAVIDADLTAKKRHHNFPNLACMKISAHYKLQGNKIVTLKTDYENLQDFDTVCISKVFTETLIPEKVLTMPNVIYGGTGFYYDKAPFLNTETEHCMPDYHLYDVWVAEQISRGIKPTALKYFTDYSIGFTTRFCFRNCKFCVNQNYNQVKLWSPCQEFVDNSRKKICLLDDNLFGNSQSTQILEQLRSINKPFQFKQGLDIRLIDKEKASLLCHSRYDGDYLFAFDNMRDKTIIEKKLDLWRSYTNKNTKLYILCSFDENGRYDLDFWKQDIINVFEKLKILMKYKCLPYLMRFEKYKESPFYGLYVNLATWCNQPQYFKKMSFKEWCIYDNVRLGGNSSTIRYLKDFENACHDTVDRYFYLSYETYLG